jgi:hypothetical protein
LKLSPDPWAITKCRGKKEVSGMVKTIKFGKLDLIGYVNIKKVGGYEGLGEYVDYEKYYISSTYPKFSGGEVYKTKEGKIVITSYSRSVKPRFLPLRKIYVYRLYVMNENDFEVLKTKLNFTPFSN